MARGRDCIYVSEEGQGTVDSSNGHQVPNSRFSGPIFRLDASAGFDPSTLERSAGNALASTFPELSLIEETSNAISQPLSEANLASFMAGAPQIHQGAMSLPTIDADSDITASSFQVARNYAFSAFNASEFAGHSRSLQGFSPAMFEPFFRDVFSIKEETSQQNEQSVAPLLHTPDAGALVDGLSQSDFIQTSTNGVQSLDPNMDSGLMSDLIMNTYDNTQLPHLSDEPSPAPVPASCSLPAPPVHHLQPIYLSNLIYDPSKPPLYTQQDLERVLPPPRPLDYCPSDPTAEGLQQYRGFPKPYVCLLI
jgi:hypothetical protein